jgi:hypothetical protein
MIGTLVLRVAQVPYRVVCDAQLSGLVPLDMLLREVPQVLWYLSIGIRVDFRWCGKGCLLKR